MDVSSIEEFKLELMAKMKWTMAFGSREELRDLMAHVKECFQCSMLYARVVGEIVMGVPLEHRPTVVASINQKIEDAHDFDPMTVN